MSDFLGDIHEGYYWVQEKYKEETEARKDTELFFPFVFLGYYVGIVALIVGIVFKTLRLNPIPPKLLNYIISGILLFLPYVFIYRYISRKYKGKDLQYEISSEDKSKKIWKYIIFFCFSLLSLFLPALINFIE